MRSFYFLAHTQELDTNQLFGPLWTTAGNRRQPERRLELEEADQALGFLGAPEASVTTVTNSVVSASANALE